MLVRTPQSTEERKKCADKGRDARRRRQTLSCWRWQRYSAAARPAARVRGDKNGRGPGNTPKYNEDDQTALSSVAVVPRAGSEA